MKIEKQKEKIFYFFKNEKIERHKGVIIEDMVFDSNIESFWTLGTKEDFVKKHIREDFVYIINDNWDEVFFDEDNLLEEMNEGWSDYLEDLKLNDYEHDILNDTWNDGIIIDILEEYWKLSNK